MAKRILIIEDDISLYNLYETALKIKNYEVSNVPHGLAALTKIKGFKPDLILLDIMLPGRNGLEILEDIKKDDAIKDTKVVMLTNFGNEANVSKALDLGALDCIMKYNIVPTELPEKVDMYIGNDPATRIKVTNS